ncbi:hypothetical protein VPH35_125421 [Triticum aestivum]
MGASTFFYRSDYVELAEKEVNLGLLVSLLFLRLCYVIHLNLLCYSSKFVLFDPLYTVQCMELPISDEYIALWKGVCTADCGGVCKGRRSLSYVVPRLHPPLTNNQSM